MEAKRWMLQDTTVFQLNADGYNLWSVQVQPGWRDDGTRTSVADMVEVADLIAAAPDLLEALTKLLNEANAIAEMARPSIGNTNVECLLTRCAEAHAAIAKAAGAA